MGLAIVNFLANLFSVFVIWKFFIISDPAHFEVSYVFKTKGGRSMLGKNAEISQEILTKYSWNIFT